MRGVAAQPLCCRKPATELAQAGENLIGTGQPTDLHRAIIPHQIDPVAEPRRVCRRLIDVSYAAMCLFSGAA
jgi:hypothetical protein